MSAVTMRNSRSGDEPPTPPIHDDGTLYPYAMYYDGSKHIAYADTPAALLEVLIPEYGEQDTQKRLESRIRLAVDAQVAVQAVINAEASPEDLAALSEADRAALLAPRFEQPRVDFWSSPIPLVVVETGYEPFVVGKDRPISAISDVENPPNMIWLHPLEEWPFLVSLAQAGFIALHEAADL